MHPKYAITRQEIEQIVENAKEEIILTLRTEIHFAITTLFGEAQQLQETNEQNELLDAINRKINRLLDMSRNLLKNERAILWYASSHDPKYKPTDGREANTVRRVMVQYAQTLLDKDITLTERSAANIVILKFSGVDGAYGPDELETFRRQINRINPPK